MCAFGVAARRIVWRAQVDGMLAIDRVEVFEDEQAALIPVHALIQRCVARWWACPATPPDLGRRYPPAEQAAHEARLRQMAEAVGTELERMAPTAADQRATQQRFIAEASRLAQLALDFTADELNAMRMDDFAEMLLAFARQARKGGRSRPDGGLIEDRR